MIMALLGYAPKADEFGGYPEGYLTAAEQSGITVGSEFEPEAPCVRGDVFIFAERALDTPLMTQTSYGSDGAGSYVICDGSRSEKGEVLVPLHTLRTDMFGK